MLFAKNFGWFSTFFSRESISISLVGMFFVDTKGKMNEWCEANRLLGKRMQIETHLYSSFQYERLSISRKGNR